MVVKVGSVVSPQEIRSYSVGKYSNMTFVRNPQVFRSYCFPQLFRRYYTYGKSRSYFVASPQQFYRYKFPTGIYVTGHFPQPICRYRLIPIEQLRIVSQLLPLFSCSADTQSIEHFQLKVDTSTSQVLSFFPYIWAYTAT